MHRRLAMEKGVTGIDAQNWQWTNSQLVLEPNSKRVCFKVSPQKVGYGVHLKSCGRFRASRNCLFCENGAIVINA